MWPPHVGNHIYLGEIYTCEEEDTVSESRDRKPRKSGGGGRGGSARGRSGGGQGGSSRGGSRRSDGSGRGRATGGSRRRDGGSSSSSGKRGSGTGRGQGRSSGGSSSGRGQGRTSGEGGRGRDGGGGYKGRDGGQRSDGGRGGDRVSDDKKQKLPAAAEGLPRHVVESLMRVTPAQRQNAALAALAAAAEAFSEGQFHVAVRKADHAKDLASRDATIREILGLASYRVGDWATALRELRTYRRLSGETTHMPVEMDVLRALGRDEDVKAVWQDFRKHGGGPAAKKEARVVYASFLIDQGDLDEAADVAGKPRIAPDPWPEDLRLWYVAARIAALQGDKSRAKHLADAIVLEDPSFPGLDDLDRLIEAG